LWLLVAAETSAPSGVSDQLVIVVGGVITAAIVALSGVLVAIVNRSSSRTTASPPAPTPGGSDLILYERTAVLARRADDADDRFDLLDKAQGTARDDLDDVLDYLDRRNPGWRP
jgi:hypothetical protein